MPLEWSAHALSKHLAPTTRVPCPDLCVQLGEYEQAVRDYGAAIALDPTNAYAYYNRGITEDKLADFKGAIAVGALGT